MHKQVIKKKCANVNDLPLGYLIIAKQRFAFNSADVIEISHVFERLELRLERSEKFAADWTSCFRDAPIRISDYAHAQNLSMTNH